MKWLIGLAALAFGAYIMVAGRPTESGHDQLLRTEQGEKKYKVNVISKRKAPQSTVHQSIKITRPPIQSKLDLSTLLSTYQPAAINLTVQFHQYAALLDSDDSGSAHLKIAHILEACTQVPQTPEALEAAEHELTNYSLITGAGNGLLLERLDHLRKRYHDCRKIDLEIPIQQYYQFMLEAADLNNTEAMVELATRIAPPDIDSWQQQDQEQHRLNMGGLLESARAQCEWRAFQAYAYPENFGSGELWAQAEPGLSPSLQAYANLVASHQYIQEHLDNAENLLDHQQQELNRRSLDLWEYDEQQAKAYGLLLYQSYCVNRPLI
jgi:hypothetical protein